jgi:tetraacyldisaccharide 4'-kinase
VSWERCWYGPRSFAFVFLVPFALVYALVTRLWHLAFDLGLRRVHRIEGARVISVGNLVVGGAGKTPVTIYLANAASARGARVAVLSRGYGRSSHSTVQVSCEALPSVAEVGDEPRLIARSCPQVTVWVGSDRVASARLAVQAGANVLLLDDGFQHRRLHRDVDVLVDAGLGNGWVLPAGPLREPLSGRARATVVWGRDGQPGDVEARHVIKAVVRPDGTRADASALAGQAVVVLTAIARPARLEADLRGLGATVVASHVFPDHHVFTAQQVAAAEADARRFGALLITTAKDAERIAVPLWVVEQSVEVVRGAALVAQLVSPPTGGEAPLSKPPRPSNQG